MDLFTITLLLIIIALAISTRNLFSVKFREMEERMINLEHYIRDNIHKTAEKEIPKPEPAQEKLPVKSPPPTVIETPKPKAPDSPPVFAEHIERHHEVITDPMSTIRRPVKTNDEEPNVHLDAEYKPTFWERNPDLEKFIGENLVNKIGILFLVLGIGYFVKLAIDNDWIGPVGRVGVGIFCGAVLIAIAHYLRNSYKAFSSVLVGGGIAVFYFTITLAFHQFNLFSQTVAFIILIVITVFAVILSLLYNREELAIIALIGGFTSPFMVSNGHANYNSLFIYLLILNLGLLAIAYNKSWRLLNILSFIFTVLLFVTVLYVIEPGSYATAFIYASIFYLLYFIINIAYNIRQNQSFIASDFGVILANTALYFAVGLYLLTAMHHELSRGLFSASLGAVNLALSFILFKNKKVDTNILYLLIGITLTFISLTAPIQLHGHYITLFWAAETVLLYWLYQKSGIALMKLTSFLLWLAMLVSLLMDIFQNYFDTAVSLPVIANKGFITMLCTAISSYLLFMLISREPEEKQKAGTYTDKSVFQVSAYVLLFLSGFLEINHQFLNHYPGADLNILYLALYVPAFIVIQNIISFKFAPLHWQFRLVLMISCIVIYLAVTPQYFEIQSNMLKFSKPSPDHFVAHWLADVFLGILFHQLIKLSKQHLQAYTLTSWLIVGGIVTFLSLELCLVSNLVFYSPAYSIMHLETVYAKTVLPVLWGLLSFILMWLGMRNKVKSFRIISLSLFTLTLIKLFIYDISNIPPAGKIIAFICLGVLLLIISFMYQKVKKLIVDEDKGAA